MKVSVIHLRAAQEGTSCSAFGSGNMRHATCTSPGASALSGQQDPKGFPVILVEELASLILVDGLEGALESQASPSPAS